jgi:hypothetical protein
MKALIIRKEWLDEIFYRGKVWEMRSRPTNVRGRILLIESGSGHIVGECNLVGCSSIPIKADDKYFDKHRVSDTDLLEKWCYPWMLSDIHRYVDPVPYNHPKGAVVWVNIPDVV